MKRLLFLAASFLCSLFTYATMTGSGTESDPYMIYTAEDLNEVRDYVGGSGIYFQLANDIDLSKYAGGEGWEPIGTPDAPFMGYFDGNGHTITNLKIDRTDLDNVGLFGYVSGGTICNLAVDFVDIKGHSSVGGIAGWSSGVIQICKVEGSLANNGDHLGGIVGYQYGGRIENCMFIGDIVGAAYTGGICGLQNLSNVIEKCFSQASIQGTDNVGGICGFSKYYYYYYTSYVQNCISANTYIISSGNNCGRIVGGYENSSYNKYVNNKSLTTTKVFVKDEEITVSNNDKNGSGLGYAMLKRKSTYTDISWDFDEVWDIDESNSFPYQRCFQSIETQKISIMPVIIQKGKNVTLNVNLDNEDTLIAFEFYLQLPEGISIALDEDGNPDAIINPERSNRHVLEVTLESNGQYHFLGYSNRNNAIKGNSGELLSINLLCSDDKEIGTYPGLIHTIKFSTESGSRIIFSKNKFDITVCDYLLGDVNNDGDIDVMDIVMMVNYMMGRPSAAFILSAADHTGDGIVDVMDLVRQVSLVMAQSANHAPAYNGFDTLESGLSLVTDPNGAVSMSLNDGKQYVASQFVVTLSEGQELTGVTTDRGHRVSIQPLADNRYFVMSYSPDNTPFAANSEALTLQVTGQGIVGVEDVAFVDSDIQKVAFQNASTVTTGISKATVGTSSMDIYSPGGILMRQNATTTEGLRNGMYIINGKKQMVK